jgi:hypothetical protein
LQRVGAKESSSGLKSTVSHGKASYAFGASRKALKILASSPPSERTMDPYGRPGQFLYFAGAEDKWAFGS